MGVYRVHSDGKAPKGLVAGDLVVTGGGTYAIVSVNKDGSYESVLYSRYMTTDIYTGHYDVEEVTE